MSSSNQPKTVDFFSYPAVENGILLNGYARGGWYIIKAFQELGYKSLWLGDESKFSVSFCQPYMYDKNEKHLRVGYTPWESTRVSPHWIEMMNEMDIIWTSSSWVADVFRSNGVKVPVEVAREGINPEEHTLTRREFPEEFTFLHVGEPARRKNAAMVIEAFRSVFPRKKNVKLVVKALKETELTSRSSRVVIDKSTLTLPQVDELYQRSHCLVYPSSGEGFGRIPLETMASGMPTILTPYSGMTEFSDYGIPVDYTVGPTKDPFNIGDWAHPKFSDLCEKMLYVYENYDAVSNTAYENAQKIRKEFIYSKGIKQAFSNLKL